jgi:hypothetical protein
VSRPKAIVVEWGSPEFDITSVLAPGTRRALATSHRGDTFIIKERSRGNLNSATILAYGLPLTGDQVQLVKDLAAEPRAYYCGRPIFKRFPPKQNFAIQLKGGADVLDLMIDLNNPSWGFYCHNEAYQDWHWVGHHFKGIAKQAFPQFASPNTKAVWQKGVIAKLESALGNQR